MISGSCKVVSKFFLVFIYLESQGSPGMGSKECVIDSHSYLILFLKIMLPFLFCTMGLNAFTILQIPTCQDYK